MRRTGAAAVRDCERSVILRRMLAGAAPDTYLVRFGEVDASFRRSAEFTGVLKSVAERLSLPSNICLKPGSRSARMARWML